MILKMQINHLIKIAIWKLFQTTIIKTKQITIMIVSVGLVNFFITNPKYMVYISKDNKSKNILNLIISSKIQALT